MIITKNEIEKEIYKHDQTYPWNVKSEDVAFIIEGDSNYARESKDFYVTYDTLENAAVGDSWSASTNVARAAVSERAMIVYKDNCGIVIKIESDTWLEGERDTFIPDKHEERLIVFNNGYVEYQKDDNDDDDVKVFLEGNEDFEAVDEQLQKKVLKYMNKKKVE